MSQHAPDGEWDRFEIVFELPSSRGGTYQRGWVPGTTVQGDASGEWDARSGRPGGRRRVLRLAGLGQGSGAEIPLTGTPSSGDKGAPADWTRRPPTRPQSSSRPQPRGWGYRLVRPGVGARERTR